MRKTKTKYFMFGLIFLLILSVSACGKKREEQIEEENTESVSEFHTEDEVIAEEGTGKAQRRSRTIRKAAQMRFPKKAG